MRGKVIYRIACGTCSVCITYGLIMQALQGENPAQTAAAEFALSPAAVVADEMPEETAEPTVEPTAVPTAEPTAVPMTEYNNGYTQGRGRGRKNHGSWGEETGNSVSGFGGRGGRGRRGFEGYEDYGNVQEVDYTESFRELNQEAETISVEDEQATGSTVQENKAADNKAAVQKKLCHQQLKNNTQLRKQLKSLIFPLLIQLKTF